MQSYHFREIGRCGLDVEKRRLLGQGRSADLQPRILDTLLALSKRIGEVVSQDELHIAIWETWVRA